MKPFILILGLLLNLSAQADSLDARSDSGIYGPKYKLILEDIQKLHETYPKLTEVYDYGKTLGGQTLRMLIVSKPNVLQNYRPTIQITGSIHGNEYLGIEDKLPGELLGRAQEPGPVQSFLNAGGVLLFVPIVNPDGYEKRRRENNNGADLNRDWDVKPAGHVAFKQPESAALANAMDTLIDKLQLDLKITVDYHCCIGALLFPWSYTSKPIAKPALELHRDFCSVAENTLDIDSGTTAEILGYYATGTTKDYYHSKYASLSFTYEGRRSKEDEYLEEHVNWWLQTIEAMNVRSIRFPIKACRNIPAQFYSK